MQGVLVTKRAECDANGKAVVSVRWAESARKRPRSPFAISCSVSCSSTSARAAR